MPNANKSSITFLLHLCTTYRYLTAKTKTTASPKKEGETKEKERGNERGRRRGAAAAVLWPRSVSVICIKRRLLHKLT